MKNLNLELFARMAFAVTLTITINAHADLLYNNTASQTGDILNFSNGQEIGNEIILGNTAAPYLTNFSFEYYSPNAAFSGAVQANVKFYKNNGAAFNGYASPGDVFYDSGFFSISTPAEAYGSSTNTAVLAFSFDAMRSGNNVNLDPNMALPGDFTVSVTFSGLNGGDSVGLPVFEPPQLGTNYGDYWFNTGTSWELRTNSVPVAFGMQLAGDTQPVPEPAVSILGVVGGMGVLMGLLVRRRRS